MRACWVLAVISLYIAFACAADRHAVSAGVRSRLHDQVKVAITPMLQQETTSGNAWKANGAACITALGNTYTLGNEIARGGAGVVYALAPAGGKTLPPGWSNELVVKVVALTDDNKEEVAIAQQIAAQVPDPHFMKAFDYFTCVAVADLNNGGKTKPLTNLYMVLEKMQGKELNDICFDHNNPNGDDNSPNAFPLSHWTVATFTAILNQVETAINDAWTRINFAHNDLQGRNVKVVFNNGVPTVKIFDYGFSSTAQHKLKRFPTCSHHFDMSYFAGTLTQCIKPQFVATLASNDRQGFQALQTRLVNMIRITPMLQSTKDLGNGQTYKTKLQAAKQNAKYGQLKTAVRGANVPKGFFAFPNVHKDHVNFLTIVVDNQVKLENNLATGAPVVTDWAKSQDGRSPIDNTDRCTP